MHSLPTVWKMPLIFEFARADKNSAKLSAKVGVLYWSVTIFNFWPSLNLLSAQITKFIVLPELDFNPFNSLGFHPKTRLVLAIA